MGKNPTRMVVCNSSCQLWLVCKPSKMRSRVYLLLLLLNSYRMKMTRKLIPRSSRCNYSSFTHGRRTERRTRLLSKDHVANKTCVFSKNNTSREHIRGYYIQSSTKLSLADVLLLLLMSCLEKSRPEKQKRKRTEYSSLTTTTATTAATTYDTQTEEISRRQQTEWSNW